MRFVVQVMKDGEWIDYKDWYGEKREYDDRGIGDDWMRAASLLPGAPTYRLYDRRPDRPRSLREAILMLYVLNGAMTDEQLCERLAARKGTWGEELCGKTEQYVRTTRSKLAKEGVLQRSETRGRTARGRTAAVWFMKHG